ncbi:MFS transporter [Microbacterium sp. LRZ72]|uniref:MFS transporter n=1 Tax=Microbacterium sp. LRZ72 TaxID=2942481 RepID=UPI0029A45C93|nr:MFS transporter [Microbacterium sp. LRZ72]MDX2376383.1 MFS transporter [Microbacterium sp. LRZ72]
MSDQHEDVPRPGILLFLAVCLIAANMRATITGIGPLLEQIEADTGLAAATLGALASVPLVIWALVSPFAHDLSQRFGLTRVVLWSLVALAAGTVLRSLPGPTASLWAGTVVIGAALSVANVLMPAVIKRDFAARVPVVTSVYTALLGGMGAVASGIVVPISHLPTPGGEAGWRVALLATGALLPFAIILWVIAQRRNPRRDDIRAPGPRARTGIWADRTAWLVGGYMGMQSAAFYMLVTWLAPIAISEGRSEVVAGFDVMLFQLMTIVGSLTLPTLLRGRLERWVPGMLPALAITGTIGLLTAPSTLTLWGMLAGLSTGAALGMSLTLMASRARDHATATALSGMAQSIGYIIGAAGPITFGALHSAVGGWQASLGLLLATLLTQAGIGFAVGRSRFVLER